MTEDNIDANQVQWPDCRTELDLDESYVREIETRVAKRLASLTLKRKLAQMIQAELASISPTEAGESGIGSILNGGGVYPNGNKHSPVEDWVRVAREFYQKSIGPDGSGIPILWGTDAVHGHSNVYGATLFPHNIGLGATRDPTLIEEVGKTSAREVLATGIDWTFAPTLAVVRDHRWGRSYEGFSEDPEMVAQYATSMIRGLQGEPDPRTFLPPDRILATAKHFIGEGGTDSGKDQGDTTCSEHELLNLHGPGHVQALNNGVQIVMAAFNSWRGSKVHGDSHLLTEVLKNQMGFQGLVISDWDGFLQIDSDPKTACVMCVNAGVDLLMVAQDWRTVLRHLEEAVDDGLVSLERVDDATRRILRVKERMGLYQRRSEQSWFSSSSILGCPEHRQLARAAARKSLVLLKNEDNLLPLSAGIRVAVLGDGSDNVAKQCGGWSLTWQGTDNVNEDFPNAQSILDGINEAVAPGGGTVQHASHASEVEECDVAVVVFGEDPYAEGDGDLEHLSFSRDTPEPVEAMRALRKRGIPVVSIFLSGRPRWINPELNASDALVVAWLPGTEGGAISDVIFRSRDGEIQFDFEGKLSFSWPRTPWQSNINRGDSTYDPLFPYGFGLSYQDKNPPSQQYSEIDPTTCPAWVDRPRSSVYSNS